MLPKISPDEAEKPVVKLKCCKSSGIAITEAKPVQTYLEKKITTVAQISYCYVYEIETALTAVISEEILFCRLNT